jgi:hypothetical protein
MTVLFKQAIEKASQLPAAEQDSLAQLLLTEMESERKWDEMFARSPEALERLANEALAEHEAGLTQELDPERL